MKILVVDDIKDSADSLALLLSIGGHQVAVAYSGYGLEEQISSFLPEIIFLDIGMPGRDGFELAAAVRSSDKFKGIVLVALTGRSGEEDTLRIKASGFSYHVIKPFDLTDIEKIIETVSKVEIS
jgi:CheY-like chemotaxis protein